LIEKRANILIMNGLVVTCDAEDTVIKNGWVSVTDSKIDMIGGGGSEDIPEAKEIIDAKECIVMPGLINTHTHLPMSLFRGLADDLPLMEWLNNHIFPAEAAHINPESVFQATLLSCAEMLLSGTTTCCDGYFYEDQVAEAVRTTGIRAVLGQGIIDFPAPGISEPEQNVSHAAAFAEKWLGRIGEITPSLFCHSAYTCSEHTLKKAKAVADEHQLLFQIHAAETREEKQQSITDHGLTPIRYLDQIGIMDENTLIVHGVWMDEEEMDIISSTNAKVAHCPESNMKLGSGIAPVREQIKAEITVGIGTDGCASNNDLDMFSEMDTASKLQKVKYLDPSILDAKKVIKMATIEGAKAIGVDHVAGSLQPGKKADIIIVDVKKPHLTPMYNSFSHVVYSARGSDVRDVIVSGKILVRSRCLLTIDLDDIFSWFHHNRCVAKE
jgi:5-methylthioadenosine/S-adenosylhomocysteine deaminase